MTYACDYPACPCRECDKACNAALPETRQRTELDVLYFAQRIGEAKTFSHQYREAWEPEDLYCPKCGRQHVWRNDDGGDYYVGEKYICAGCGSSFYLPGGVCDAADDEQNEQRRLALTPNV